jgi:hypothetical protein
MDVTVGIAAYLADGVDEAITARQVGQNQGGHDVAADSEEQRLQSAAAAAVGVFVVSFLGGNDGISSQLFL